MSGKNQKPLADIVIKGGLSRSFTSGHYIDEDGIARNGDGEPLSIVNKDVPLFAYDQGLDENSTSSYLAHNAA